MQDALYNTQCQVNTIQNARCTEHNATHSTQRATMRHVPSAQCAACTVHNPMHSSSQYQGQRMQHSNELAIDHTVRSTTPKCLMRSRTPTPPLIGEGCFLIKKNCSVQLSLPEATCNVTRCLVDSHTPCKANASRTQSLRKSTLKTKANHERPFVAE